MYVTFYKLSVIPFQLTPDSRFLGITGDVVDATAAELAHDLKGLGALEPQRAVREQVFRRLTQMLSAGA